MTIDYLQPAEQVWMYGELVTTTLTKKGEQLRHILATPSTLYPRTSRRKNHAAG